MKTVENNKKSTAAELAANATAMECVKQAATLLRGKKLKNVNKAAPWLDRLCTILQFGKREQAIAFVAVFDRQCATLSSDLDDLAEYFACSHLDVATLIPSLREMSESGLLTMDTHCFRPGGSAGTEFNVDNTVFCSIVENQPVKWQKKDKKLLDQYDFCARISDMVEDDNTSKQMLFRRTEMLEQEYADFELVKYMQRFDVESRVWFYEMCNDFMKDGHTNLYSTINDIYPNSNEGLRVRTSFLNGEQPLIVDDLIEQCDRNEFTLTDDGKCLLLGKDAEAYGVSLEPLDRYGFVEKISKYVLGLGREVRDRNRKLLSKMEKLEKKNTHLTFLEKVKNYAPTDRLLFYLAADEFADGNGLTMRVLERIYDKREAFRVQCNIQRKAHPLFKDELLDLETCGFFSETNMVLTDNGKALFLEEEYDAYVVPEKGNGVKHYADIQAKHLFFDAALDKQLRLVRDSLEEKQYASLRKRLEEKNMPKGIAVLLYGAPGTGKTESVLQMAKATGRDILHVDISQTKSCWFGESEKLIKQVFTKYRSLCKRSAVKPILLFNEADAIFAKRKDTSSSNVAQTENAIQNIILEEMENLDGILIATTNLADNLDAAFERRFLFKIRFERPNTAAKQQIWLDKMPALSANEARQLAEAYNFSGGEIDNIVRKATMSELLDGACPDFAAIQQFCKEERLQTGGSRRIGF